MLANNSLQKYQKRIGNYSNKKLSQKSVTVIVAKNKDEKN